MQILVGLIFGILAIINWTIFIFIKFKYLLGIFLIALVFSSIALYFFKVMIANSPKYIIAVGLFFGIVGSTLLIFHGFPDTTIFSEGEQLTIKVKGHSKKIQKTEAFAKLGSTLLVAGFLFQLSGVVFKQDQ